MWVKQPNLTANLEQLNVDGSLFLTICCWFRRGCQKSECEVHCSREKSKEEKCCKWKGISCDNMTGHVVMLNLRPRIIYGIFGGRWTSISGEIGTSLLELKHLSHLDLSLNYFEKIPEFIGSLAELTYLNLSDNPLTGFIPYQLGNLSRLQNLVELDLSYNYFLSSIPDTFDNMPSLERINFEQTNLEGGIPQTLGNLCTLEELNLQGNILSGTLTVAVKNLSGYFSKLSVLTLEENRFTGPLPDLSRLSSLRKLYLKGNRFEGPLPLSIGEISQLVLLDVSYNSLHGVISEAHLSNLAKLQRLSISFNSLSFHPSSDWIPPLQLNFIGLASSEFGPQFPNWLKKQANFSHLDISNSNISDAIPDWFWNLPSSLKFLNLSFNQIGVIDLNSNLFYVLNLSNNKFNGSLSFLCTTDGWTLLDLNTSLHGEIPQSLKSCTRLRLLDLGENKLTGTIPPWIGERLENLVVLRLRSNKFHGDMPSSLCQQQFLQVLDLSLNNISGIIPSCFNNLTAMADLESSEAKIEFGYNYFVDYDIGDMLKQCFVDLYKLISSNGIFDDHLLVIWKGVEQEYGKTLGLLRVINLACNKLSGEIPREIASLHGLISLNLSRNMLKGSIIKKIGQLKALESFDLSTNNLSGVISESMSDLFFLSVLDLSNNNLSGKIPLSTQLQSFNATCSAGNPGLCGDPLNKCFGDESPKSPNNGGTEIITESDEELFEPLWFFTGTTVGFLVGFWGVFGSLLINRSWRDRYFRLVNKLGDWIRLTMALETVKLQQRLRLKD
ncbi:hypothetical protein ES288_A07G103700v1 [Gossypium darwinii]|uniref:Leucine-rich repeat-containing N-terminal plant-type domain-containing protein n=1 Tax=Gossypium darwinii TaxID=34276 RepID=A0A5D2FWD5_GOSDA|nr:hypothetical protein ES288_A07G103700v1 [Gossypium darwinii]